MEFSWDLHCHLLNYCLSCLLFYIGRGQWLQQGLSSSLTQKTFGTLGSEQSIFIFCLCFKSFWVDPCTQLIDHPGTQPGDTSPFKMFIRGYWEGPYMLCNVLSQSDICYFCSESILSTLENSVGLFHGIGKRTVSSIWQPISMTANIVGRTHGGLSHWEWQGLCFECVCGGQRLILGVFS